MLVYILLVALDWPMYGHDLCNTHRQEGKGAMTSAVIKWSYNTGFMGQVERAPTLADINNDGYLEVIANAHGQGKLYTFSYTGTLLWVYTMGDLSFMPVAAADIDNDGYDEIMFGNYDDKLYVINHDGSFSWTYTTGGNTLWCGPKVADIDNDGFYEIIIGSEDHKLYVINHDGSFLWSYTTGGAVQSTAAVADIDNDGFYEIIFGSADAYVYALNHDGSFLWSYPTAGYVYTPTVADINNDGFYEIIFLTGGDNKIYALTHDGIFIWSYPIGTVFSQAALAVADIDGDGQDEIIVGSGTSGNGKVYALNHDGTLYWSFNIGGSVHCAPTIADVDGDGWYEILSPKFDLSTTELYCLNHDGSVCWTIPLQRDIHDAAIGDIDCDSCLEVVVGTYDDNYVYVLDDPLNTSGCTAMGIDEKEELRVKKLELRVTRDEVIFSISNPGLVNLKLYDICGRLSDCLIESYIAKGSHRVNLPNLHSGIYFVVLTHNGARLTDKLVVIK